MENISITLLLNAILRVEYLHYSTWHSDTRTTVCRWSPCLAQQATCWIPKNHHWHHIKWTWCFSVKTKVKTMIVVCWALRIYREWTTPCQMCLGLQTWRLQCCPTFLDLLFHELYVSSAIDEQRNYNIWVYIGHNKWDTLMWQEAKLSLG